MYPATPHEDPHEFLMIQYVEVYPTTTTAWLNAGVAAQLVKIPDE